MSAPETSQTRDYFWNTAASLMLSLTTAVLLLVVQRSAGLWAAGVFSLANSVGQQFQSLGMYEVRTYHVTDARHRFSFGTYLATRLVTVGAMIAGIIGYAVVSGADLAGALLIAMIACLRVFDAFEDVFYCEFQREGRLDVAGRACFFRTLATIVVFSGVLVVSGSMLVAAAATLIVSTVVLLGAYLPPARGMFDLRPRWELRPIGQVLVECLPLFLASFIALYLANAPRFAIDRYLDPERQGYFAIIFMPAFTINLLSFVIFRPLLTQMANRWVGADRAGFAAIVRKGLLGTLAAFAAVALATYTIGAPALRLVYGTDVSGSMLELMVLVTGGALNAAGVVLYYALTTMRLQRLVFAGYAAAAVAITLLCAALVPAHALLGASAAYAGAMAVLVAFFLASLLLALRRTASRAPAA
ncbi:lipopolysaccharide biosynthesis protein [Actinomyces israelii]|uniref:lipopolysaccharide biosynthesis protein n=1 Tax=Actinomyces israelii TaxID=1659 RepID=UPI0005BE2E49|nr:polysaccharide biosynthesis protein [Actinomyces israelii]